MEKIKQYILKSNLTVSELSRQSGVSRVTIHYILSSRNDSIRLMDAFRLADALGVDVNEFRSE